MVLPAWHSQEPALTQRPARPTLSRAPGRVGHVNSACELSAGRAFRSLLH